MKTTRRLVFVFVAIVMVTGLYYAFRPYEWTAQLNVPPGVMAQSATFSCAPLFASNYVHAPANIPYKFDGTPCSERQQYQIMDVADIAGGALALGFLLVWPLRHRHIDAPVPAS